MPGRAVASGDRVALRTAEPADAEFLQRSTTDPEIRFPLGSVNPYSEHATEEWLKNRDEKDGGDMFVVTDEDADGEPIGSVHVSKLDRVRPSLAYWLIPECHGEGYGSESVSLAVDYVFRTYDKPSLGAYVFDFNEASQGLLESLGFVREGRSRKNQFVDGEYRDSVNFGILREEWTGGE